MNYITYKSPDAALVSPLAAHNVILLCGYRTSTPLIPWREKKLILDEEIVFYFI